MAEFAPPPWSAPFDATTYLESIPSDSRVRGLFFRNLIQQTKQAGGTVDQTFVPFQFYPGVEYNRMLLECARLKFPQLPEREALRQLGHTVYGTFLDSTIGKVLFAFAGRDPRAAFRVAPRAYDIASGGTIEARVVGDGPEHSTLQLRNIWTFPTCHEVGVIEGALQAFGTDASVEVFEHSACDVDLRVYWR